MKYDPIIVPCPYTGIFASVGFIFFILIILVLVVLIVIAFNKNFFQNVGDIVRQKMKESGNTKQKKQDYVNIVRNTKLN